MTRQSKATATGRSPHNATPDSEVRIVHSSDLHVDTDYNAHLYDGDGTKGLAGVLDTAHALGADAVVLAGDVFENNRLPLDVLRHAGDLLDAFGKPVVILPGNHDPAIVDSAHHRGGFADLANVAILGVTHAKAARFAALDLEIWGRAHRDYDDMSPLAEARPRRTRWQIAVAHGHYEPRPDFSTPYRPSWLIGAADIAAAASDYVALGHWNRPVRVGGHGMKAYYSGCPELAGTVNLVRLTPAGTVVMRKPLRWR